MGSMLMRRYLKRRQTVAVLVLERPLAEQQYEQEDEQRQKADAGQEQDKAGRERGLHGQQSDLHAGGVACGRVSDETVAQRENVGDSIVPHWGMSQCCHLTSGSVV